MSDPRHPGGTGHGHPEDPPADPRDAAEERLSEWAAEHGWQIAFPNDSLGPDERPGLIDAVLLRANPRQPNSLQMQLVRLHLGPGQPPAGQARRLHDCLEQVSAMTLYACVDGDDLHFVETDALLRGR